MKHFSLILIADETIAYVEHAFEYLNEQREFAFLLTHIYMYIYMCRQTADVKRKRLSDFYQVQHSSGRDVIKI